MTKRARFIAVAMATSSLLVAVPGAQAEVRVSKNFPMQSDSRAFRGKDAIALAVNPRNPNHVVAINNEYLVPNCEGTASFNGGLTWDPANELPVPVTPPGTPAYARACSRIGDHLAESENQTVAFGSGQNVYAAYATRRLTGSGPGDSGGTESQGIMVAKSTDGGRTWTSASVALPGGALQSPYYELPTIAVRPGATAGTDRVVVAAHENTEALGGCNFVTPAPTPTNPNPTPQCQERGDAAVSVSNNSGATFSAPVAAEGAGTRNVTDVSQPAFAPNGDVYLAWRTVGATGAIEVARSTDGGLNWNAPVVTATVVNNAANTSNPPGPLASSGSSYPRIAVGPNGSVYIVYNQASDPGPGAPAGGFQGADHFIPPDSDVYFQRSANNGAAWSQPKLINDATPRPGNESPYQPAESLGRAITQTRHPNLAVAPNGRIDIVWQDRRHWYRGCIHTHVPCEEARLGDTYLAQSSDNGTNFTPDRRVSDRSHNNDVGYDYRFGTGWTYGPVVQPMGNGQSLIAWMDSRHGSFDTDRQDIYLAKVNMNGPASVPQESLQRTDPASTSVRLSQHTYPGGGEGLLSSVFATRNGTRVVIAPQGDAAAILAAGVLARAHLSQVLLSPPGGLPASVVAEVRRMRPAGAFIVGGTDALSGQIATDLANAGVPTTVNGENQIVRLSGSGAEVARQIATTLDRRTAAQKTANVPAFSGVTLVNPNSPDAYAVAGLAAARRLPVLFTEDGTVSQATRDTIANLRVNQALVVGGSQVVSDAAAGALGAGVQSERLGGADQYATSRAVVAESVERGLSTNLMYVADGTRPVDAALLGSTVGRVTGLMALSRPPLSSTAGATAAAAGLAGQLDRMILLQPVAAAPRPTPTPPAQPADFPGCPTLTANVIRGTTAANTINGTTAADRIFAGTGNDVVDALAGNDCVDLGTGSDRGQGGLGNDLMLSGTGNDRVSGSSGNDNMRGNSGNDRVEGGRGNDLLVGDSGNDSLLGSFGNDRMHGVSGKDRISGSRGRDRINGGSNNDRISGGSSGDRIAGDAGSDRINGNSGGDRISGNSGNDRITSQDNSRDRVNCGTGRDSVLADRRDIVSRNCERVRRR